MKLNLEVGIAASAIVAVLLSAPVGAQKNYTDGGDLYGGAHAPTGKETPAKQGQKKTQTPSQRSGKFDPYTEGSHAKTSNGSVQKSTGDDPQLPDDVAKSGKFDPYTDGMSK